MNQLQREQDPKHFQRSILPHITKDRWRHNCSRMSQTQSYIKTQEINWIMDNLGSIQSFKKHRINISKMKWEDYAKDREQGKMG